MAKSHNIENPSKLGALIKKARIAQHLTQVELAGLCKTSPRFIVELEKGKITCQIGKVLYVIKMLGLTLKLDGLNND